MNFGSAHKYKMFLFSKHDMFRVSYIIAVSVQPYNMLTEYSYNCWYKGIYLSFVVTTRKFYLEL